MAIPLSYNLRNLRARRYSTLSAALGIGLVVMVFNLVLALAFGFAYALQTAGSPDNAIVLRKGSNAEVSSAMTQEESDSILVRPEIARNDRSEFLGVREVVVLVVMPRRADGAPAQVVVRGTAERVLELRDKVRLTPGSRMFTPGLAECIVGRALAERVQNLELGQTVRFQRRDWKIVGVFDTGGTGFESEVWGDVNLIQAAFDREGIYQSVTFRMASPQELPSLKASLEVDPRYQVEVKTEAQYYADQAGTLSTFIGILGTLITTIMAIGAVFGAMNTMYAAVGSRAREIAVLRALGFSRRSILVSFLFESLVLAALGGVLGCLFALPLNGITTSTINWDTFSELAFAFRVTPTTLMAGFAFAIIMGGAGGLLPAVRAARTPITVALRQI